MRNWLGWGLLLVALLGVAWLARYSYVGRLPASPGIPPGDLVWDRWRHRVCAFTSQTTVCYGPHSPATR